MSEWDYLPTPYQSLIQQQEKHLLLTILSLICLIQNQQICPIEIFKILNIKSKGQDLSKKKDIIKEIIDKQIKKRGVINLVKQLLSYEELKTSKKRDELVKIITDYVRGNGTENL